MAFACAGATNDDLWESTPHRFDLNEYSIKVNHGSFCLEPIFYVGIYELDMYCTRERDMPTNPKNLGKHEVDSKGSGTTA